MKVKRLLCVVLVLAVIASIAAVTFAAEGSSTYAVIGRYYGYVQSPSASSYKVVSGVIRAQGGFSPWFQSDFSTVRTAYVLSASNDLSQLAAHRASNTVYTSNTVRQDMTYNTGHGGSGNSYWLIAYCNEASYNTYLVQGSWSPD